METDGRYSTVIRININCNKHHPAFQNGHLKNMPHILLPTLEGMRPVEELSLWQHNKSYGREEQVLGHSAKCL